jgi:hypothetical protein
MGRLKLLPGGDASHVGLTEMPVVSGNADAGVSTANNLLAVDRPPLQDEVVNYCPFGCEKEDLDDHGYCEHLIGFKNGKSKKYEPIRNWKVKVKDGDATVEIPMPSVQCGRKMTRMRDCPPESEDVKYINPIKKQMVHGVVNMAYSWVSTRIYVRLCPKMNLQCPLSNPRLRRQFDVGKNSVL